MIAGFSDVPSLLTINLNETGSSRPDRRRNALVIRRLELSSG